MMAAMAVLSVAAAVVAILYGLAWWIEGPKR